MDKMREEFEAWMLKYWFDPNLTADKRGYENEIVSQQWNAWQASRAALVVELPHVSTLKIGNDELFYRGDVIEALDEAGVAYK